MRLPGNGALTDPAAGLGTVEHRQMLLLEARCSLDGQAAEDVVLGELNLRSAESEMGEQVECRRIHLRLIEFEHLLAEINSNNLRGEQAADSKHLRNGVIELAQLCFGESQVHQRALAYHRTVDQRTGSQHVVHYPLHRDFRVALFAQAGWHSRHGNLEHASPSEILELDERVLRLDTGGVRPHHQSDGSGGRDDGGLSIAVAVLFSLPDSRLPGGAGRLVQVLGALLGVDGHWQHAQPLILVDRSVVRSAHVVAHDAHHRLAVVLELFERTEERSHLG